MLTCIAWLWGSKYKGHYADRLFGSLDRHIAQKYRSVLITDQPVNGGADEVWPIEPQDRDLIYTPGCFARLRMFDPEWQARHNIAAGDRVVSVDLDAVIVGALDPLFDCDDEFRILQHVNTTNKCPFNGSLWMFRAGGRPDVWRDFGMENYKTLGVPFHAFPDDQGWLHHKFPDAKAWTDEHGVYAFKKKGWPIGDALPENARFVAFPGWRDPSRFGHLDWVKQNWRV